MFEEDALAYNCGEIRLGDRLKQLQNLFVGLSMRSKSSKRCFNVPRSILEGQSLEQMGLKGQVLLVNQSGNDMPVMSQLVLAV